MVTVITVLKSGGEYKPEHVYRLGGQVLKHNPSYDFLCLSDLNLDCEHRHLIHNWRGWWSKIELFSPELSIDGNIIYLDLDTDVNSSIDSLICDKFTMLSDFYRPHLPASGVMAWGDKYKPVEVYNEFIRDAHYYIDTYSTSARWGDQGFIRDYAKNIERFDNDIIASYKAHCKQGVPEWAKVVAYHGRPKPWDL